MGEAFAWLWDSINKKSGYGWDKDPWVWRYQYEYLKDYKNGINN